MIILRNIQNNQVYQHIDGNKYLNLVTGVEGEVAPEIAQKVFKINLEMTDLCYRFPNIQELVKSLKLKFDK